MFCLTMVHECHILYQELFQYIVQSVHVTAYEYSYFLQIVTLNS